MSNRTSLADDGLFTMHVLKRKAGFADANIYLQGQASLQSALRLVCAGKIYVYDTGSRPPAE